MKAVSGEEEGGLGGSDAGKVKVREEAKMLNGYEG